VEFSIGKSAKLLDRLRDMPIKLDDVVQRIGQGIRTSANEVYVLDRRAENGNSITVYSKQLNREVTVERYAVAPFLQGREIKNYRVLPSGKCVVIPYRVVGERVELIPEKEMQNQFPKALEYLR
jgi:hypothetical protein